MKVAEFCSREVVIVGREETILDAARLMRKYHVGNVVVVEERAGRRYPVGILTDRDIVVELIANEIPFDAVSIGDVMSFELLTVREEDSLLDTIKRMQDRGVRRLPVVDAHGALKGIVAMDDMLELVAEQLVGLVKSVTKEQQKERDLRE